MIIDPERVAKIMRETAEIDVLPRFQNLSESEIMEKAPGDIVTVADYEAEKRAGGVVRPKTRRARSELSTLSQKGERSVHWVRTKESPTRKEGGEEQGKERGKCQRKGTGQKRKGGA